MSSLVKDSWLMTSAVLATLAVVNFVLALWEHRNNS